VCGFSTKKAPEPGKVAGAFAGFIAQLV